MQERSDDELRAFVEELQEDIREAGEPEEPSDDERHHPERERRREIARDRVKREHARLQEAMDKVLPEVFAAAREALRRQVCSPVRWVESVQRLSGIAASAIRLWTSFASGSASK